MKTVTAAQYYIRLTSGEIVVLDYQFDGLKDLVEMMENQLRQRGTDAS